MLLAKSQPKYAEISLFFHIGMKYGVPYPLGWPRETQDVKKHHNPMGCGVFWRSERDLNPRAHFGTPTPLAGEPLRPLGYHSESKHVQLLPGYSSITGIVCQEEKC